MVLTVLRVLPVARSAIITLFLAIFLTASGTLTWAERARTHKRTPTATHAAQHARSKTAGRTVRHTSSHRTGASRRLSHRSIRSAAHRRTRVRRARVVRARMPIRRYSWMAHSRHIVHPGDREIASAPAVGEVTDDTATTEIEPTAGDAAARIAAREMLTPHPVQPIRSGLSPFPSPNTRVIAMAPLRGSLDSLVRQNEKTDADNLERIENDADLQDRIAHGVLVPVPVSSGLTINPNLPPNRRYCRPWTAAFLTDLSHAHEARFHRPVLVSSAVRTVEYQKQLMRINGNAAAAEGDIASPHLTGATIDIAKQGLTRSELYWMRDRLNRLQNAGKIDVEEEFRQACFHITVYKSYLGEGPPHKPTHRLAAPPADDDDDSLSAAHGR